ncbi:Glucoamylase GLU1 precursor [Spathaspora passalidarum NRRL Y-27907]|uniref:glucan 1,4-alpha-glucosidase n=1 Tax=Spathaspora passalidarum (strain NRRL Y-27907 / 11-Y1) TaxID=619300 RepID=G3ARV6_SPAPN|nr:Glucoamylase GLU1 precursor [Spathaspora passalidarum NRRL Y-27907]EGW31373.1 Glucoamylase GLU1 precursor [Spathaspora passalidarum NRRL Y-27907]
MKLSNFLLYSIAFTQTVSGIVIPQHVLDGEPPAPISPYQSISDLDFETWLEKQKAESFHSILNNIGGTSEVFDEMEVYKGVVIASPSKIYPNYFYQWTRDAAITIKTLLYELEDQLNTSSSEVSKDTGKLVNVIESYIENSYNLQRLPNLSGSFEDDDKSGLGEPKFHVNNTPFNEVWGRPQRDGPGLRAATIMYYLEILNKFDKQVQSEFLKSTGFIYKKIIKPDLIYIMKNWDLEGFDLWEEINAVHFFTSITQLRAIKDGIFWAEHFHDESFKESLVSTFGELQEAIENELGFKSDMLPHIIECPSIWKIGKRKGLDAASLLGSIHSHETSELRRDDPLPIPFDIDDSSIINTLAAMVADMKFRYPINHNKIGLFGTGVALGRYPEDIYDGYSTTEGNPWFISTATAGEIIYRMIFKLKSYRQDIIINASNRDFFHQFINFENSDDEGDDMVIPFNSAAYNMMIANLFKFSDSFLQVVKEHVDSQGRMSEQFNKYHGYMQGARELTWSYSAVWNAIRWREKTLKVL